MMLFLEVNGKLVRDHFLIELKIFLIQFLKIHFEIQRFLPRKYQKFTIWFRVFLI